MATDYKEYVNQKELAGILNITPRRVRDLKNEGVITEDDAGRGYPLKDNVQSYINFKVEYEKRHRRNEDRRAAALDKEAIQTEHEGVKKDIEELKLRRMKGELYRADNVESFVNTKFQKFARDLESMPAKMVLATEGEPPKRAEEIIKKMLCGLLDDLESYNPDDYIFKDAYTDYDPYTDDDTEDEDDEE